MWHRMLLRAAAQGGRCGVCVQGRRQSTQQGKGLPGARPRTFLGPSTLAPLPSSRRTISTCPMRAAQMSGVVGQRAPCAGAGGALKLLDRLASTACEGFAVASRSLSAPTPPT